MTGWFIAFEGGEASGKTTQAERLAAHLDAVLTREPGGTPLAERIREIVLNPAERNLAPRAEALLIAGARAQHVAELIRPTLASGRTVVSDRFVGSSLAYQGHGRGLPVDDVAALSQFAVDGVEPDVVVLIDVPDDVADSRLGEELDRFESEDRDFHRRVRAGYRSLATASPATWVVVDGVGSVDDVAQRVREVVEQRLGSPDG